MKRFSRIFFYLRDQKDKVIFYVGFNLLSIVLSLVSLAMLVPFLQFLFGMKDLPTVAPKWEWTSSSLQAQLDYGLSYMITHYGRIQALATICGIVVISIFLKNITLYMSYRMLIPLRNKVMTKFREELYEKILRLPVSYFTEQRKGDMMSRMSNDMNEIEWCVIGTLEGMIKDPLNILILLVMLIFLSPLLSAFLLVLLPVTGFIIGRVSRSLKKQSGKAQEEQGLLLSILDETLGGLRVIKAFNAEKLMRLRFVGSNNLLNQLRIKMAFRRDLASPLSEFLSVIVLCCILWFGGQMVLNNQGGLAAGTFILYIVTFTQIIQPAKALSQAFYNMQRGAAAIERIESVLTAPLAVKESDTPRHLHSFEKAI
jgi:subfamily B ATP-binding cassette protein MsbA